MTKDWRKANEYLQEKHQGQAPLRLSEVQAHECESLPLRLVRLALLQVRRKNPGGAVMGWMALILAFDGFLTKVSHPEAAGYIYIAAGLFAIADSIANWRNKS